MNIQPLIPGFVAPAAPDPIKLELAARAQKRGEQQKPAGGMFDNGALSQLDLVDLARVKA